ncbi:MAG: hypothetical protein PSV22_02835 [Pseudolabrys sp.]|nr:hypothetical protein [Pseudolabrys sp.]
MISVGGVLLAITILGLALIPPGRPHMHLAASNVPAHGALIDRRAHPEWRQFLILAALRRAGELDRLRALPESPNVLLNVAPSVIPAEDSAPQTGAKFAGLPVAREDAGPDDDTGSINVAPSATIPIDIGETSSLELPVAPAEEKPPVAKSPALGMTESGAAENVTPVIAAPNSLEPPLSKVAALPPPEQAKPVVIIHKRNVRKGSVKPARAAEVPLPPPFNILQAIFASLSGKQGAAPEQPANAAIARRPTVKPRQTANIR